LHCAAIARFSAGFSRCNEHHPRLRRCDPSRNAFLGVQKHFFVATNIGPTGARRGQTGSFPSFLAGGASPQSLKKGSSAWVRVCGLARRRPPGRARRWRRVACSMAWMKSALPSGRPVRVHFRPENRLPGVVGLGHVVRQGCDYDASEPSQPRKLAEKRPVRPRVRPSRVRQSGSRSRAVGAPLPRLQRAGAPRRLIRLPAITLSIRPWDYACLQYAKLK